MAKAKKYLNNAALLEEIKKSKAIQKKYPKRSPAQCLTPELVNMLSLLVERYASRANWRNYSYIADMQAEALVSLCQSALKFDEKYKNPFGYYTQIAHRSFLTFLESEKKQRNIKDAMIEMNDSGHYGETGTFQPSFARQHEEGLDHLDYAKKYADEKKKEADEAKKAKEQEDDRKAA